MFPKQQHASGAVSLTRKWAHSGGRFRYITADSYITFPLGWQRQQNERQGSYIPKAPSQMGPLSENAESEPKQVANIVKKVMDEQKVEDHKRENREQNFVIFRAPESNSSESSERVAFDQDFVERLIAEPLELGKWT